MEVGCSTCKMQVFVGKASIVVLAVCGHAWVAPLCSACGCMAAWATTLWRLVEEPEAPRRAEPEFTLSFSKFDHFKIVPLLVVLCTTMHLYVITLHIYINGFVFRQNASQRLSMLQGGFDSTT